MTAVGVVLAAGAGTRYGGPKGLARTASGEPWVQLACSALLAGGCSDVIVVLGARAAEVAPLVPSWAVPVVASGWSRGVSASLRAGLAAATATSADVAVVTLVDLPGLRPEAVARVLHDAGRSALRRAVYAGRPGHPVLLGRDHWTGVSASVRGDTGAGPYLREHGVVEVDCTDLGGGDDVDEPGR